MATRPTGRRRTADNFTIHVILSHHPFIASLFLSNLFEDFPDSKWKLPPMVPLPARPALPTPEKLPERLPEKPPKKHSSCNTVGRYILPDTVPATTTLKDLFTLVTSVHDLNPKQLAQFTIFPQSVSGPGHRSVLEDKPLAWNLSLAEVAVLDAGSFNNEGGQWVKNSAQYAPAVLLVLETKAAALARIVGDSFDAGENFTFEVRDAWSAYDSFWHMHVYHYPCGLTAAMPSYREAMSRLEHVKKERERGKSAWEKDLAEQKRKLNDLETSMEKVKTNWMEGEITREIYRVEEEIRRLEGYIKSGPEATHNVDMSAKRDLDTYAHQWDQWVIKKSFNDSEPPEIAHEHVDEKVKTILRQSEAKAAEWRRGRVKASCQVQ